MMQQMLVGLGGVSMPDVSYNLIGGGGGGINGNGWAFQGAGGAGSVLVQGIFTAETDKQYFVLVGAAGAGSAAGAASNLGWYSGGEGVGYNQIGTSTGGGTGTFQGIGADGGSNTSYSGGAYGFFSGGGGAGAGGNGGNAGTRIAGNGGPGVAMPLHPSSLRVGGGGAGDGQNSGSGSATDGGGLRFGTAPASRGGGGGAGNEPGASGRIVLRYGDSFPAPAATTGNPTVTVSGGYRYYDFTSSGSITF